MTISYCTCSNLANCVTVINFNECCLKCSLYTRQLYKYCVFKFSRRKASCRFHFLWSRYFIFWLGLKKTKQNKNSNVSGYWMPKTRSSRAGTCHSPHTIHLRSRPKLPDIVLAEQVIWVWTYRAENAPLDTVQWRARSRETCGRPVREEKTSFLGHRQQMR